MMWKFCASARFTLNRVDSWSFIVRISFYPHLAFASFSFWNLHRGILNGLGATCQLKLDLTAVYLRNILVS